MDNRFKPGMKGLIVLMGIFIILFGYMYQCLAFPAWPVPEDRIGIHDDNTKEFLNFGLAPPAVIEYHVGDDNWSVFPDKLTNKPHNPHTVQIFFDTNTNAGNRNLILGVNSDAPDQKLSIYFDGRHVGEELIQTGTLAEPFPLHTFWLGEIEKGPHTITIVNQSSPNPDTAYGIFFDFLQLVSPTPQMITIPDDYPTIMDGIREAVPGDIVYVKKDKDIYNENIILRSGIIMEGEDPGETIIDGGGKTVVVGAYQSQVKGFTIRNGGHTEAEDQGFGVKVYHDLMSLSNNIILSCAIGVFLSGQNLNFSNNTIAKNNCCMYIQRSEVNSPDPGVKCKNNIFSDSNCALWVLSGNNSDYSIDANNIDQVIPEFSYNNVSTKLKPYILKSYMNLFDFGKGNIQIDPYFIDPNGGDYHLRSYSRCIDAGDPNADFWQELEDNGQRINMGAFGNTPSATRTLDEDGDGAKDYLEGLVDRDLNGKQDWLDKQIGVFISAAGNKEIRISMEGEANTPLAFKEIRAIEQTDPNISGFLPPISHILYGFWGFKIIGLNHGAKITVTIHFPQRLFETQDYFAYDPYTGWVEMSIKQDVSGGIIFIDLSDGDTGDRDRTPNGSISHIGGIGVDFPIHEDLGSIDCFIRSVEVNTKRLNLK